MTVATGGDRNRARWAILAFGAAFTLIGGVAAAFFLVLPVWRSWQARTWAEVPCTILASRLGESTDEDGTTYRVEVRFRYRYGGRWMDGPEAPAYESDRYDLMGGVFTSGREDKEAELARLPPGAATVCWVDPARHEQAVLRRELPDLLWFGLLTLLFPIVGIVLMVAGWRLVRP